MNGLMGQKQSKKLKKPDTAEKIRKAFDKIARNHATTPDDALTQSRTAALEMLKKTLSKGHKRAHENLLNRDYRGGKCAEVISALMDNIIVELSRFANQLLKGKDGQPISCAIVAVGGYGRQRLAPGSDIDLLFITPQNADRACLEVVEFILYMLWDMGLKIGHATRDVDNCISQAKEDMTIRTAMLEARFLTGDEELFTKFRSKFAGKILSGSARSFVKAKLDERDHRHKRSGESRYLVEPNVKEGKGGLRDLNTLFWIAKYCYAVDTVDELVSCGFLSREELNLFKRCDNFLWAVRCHLHFLTGRAEERLGFDNQSAMAEAMGFKSTSGLNKVERFMRQYFLIAKDVGDLTRIFCARLEAEQTKPGRMARLPALFQRQKQVHGFTISGQRLTMVRSDVFRRNPVNLIRMFKIANDYKLLIDPNTLREVTRSRHLIDKDLRENPEANKLFLEILTSRNHPERILRRMNEAGVLGKLLPDFGRIVAMMQFNMYHHYTADEHLLRAIGILSELERGELEDDHPLAHRLMSQNINRKVIYLAVLLHDIAKGRPEDHSLAGARIARRLGPRLGLTKNETELVAWLVEYHLVMSDTAQRRDLTDPQTIEDFVSNVQTLERLRHLLVLTVVDIRAVGPGVWNGWKGQLLRELYFEAEAMLVGTASHANRPLRVANAQKEFLDVLQMTMPDWSEAKCNKYIARHHDAYWLSYDIDTKIKHAALLSKVEGSGFQAEVTEDKKQDVLELNFTCPDHPGLFSRLSGACAVAGLTIVDAKLAITKDGMALDVLRLQEPERESFPDKARVKRLIATIQSVLHGEILPPDRLADVPFSRRVNAFKLANNVTIDNDLSSHSTVIEVSGLDCPGLLYALAKTLFNLNVTIVSARAVTFGERAVDVFYVQDLTGEKITRKSKLTAIMDGLQMVLANQSEPPRAKQSKQAKPTKPSKQGRKAA